jgi:predicted RND superfamily exporter protein
MPRDDATAESFAIARETALRHPLVKGQMLSADGKTTLVTARIEGSDLAVGEVEPTVLALRELIDRAQKRSEVQIGLTGIPPIRVDVYNAVQRDQVVFLAFGAAVAGLIAFILFRRPAALFIVCLGPVLGTLWTLGALGIAGEPINTFNSILPALVLVIGFTDAVHFMVEIRRLQGEGKSPRTAAQITLRHLILPCGLTSLTTAVGFGSLMVAEMEVIQRFGAACAAGAIMNFLAVVLLVPLLSSTRLGHYVAGGKGVSMEERTYGFLRIVIGWITKHARPVALLGCVATVALVAVALELEPENRIRESLPSDSDSYRWLVECEEQFGGALSSYVVVEWPERYELSSPQVLQAISDVHGILNAEADLGEPFSVLNVLAALPHRKGQLASAIPYLDRLPSELRDTLVRQDLRKAAVRVQTPDTGCRRLTPVLARIEGRLQGLVRDKHPGFRASLTGSPVLAARNIRLIIVDLCRSLSLASIIIFGVMTIVFRSVRRGLISVLPNVFPLAAAAALLVVVRDGALEISSVITFSVCLGIAVDDTIHFISRFDRELKGGRDVSAAVQRSVAKVGAALLVTTLTLLGGFGAGLFSELPAMRSFAVLSCAALTAALGADVLILPALLVWFGKSRRERAASASRTDL